MAEFKGVESAITFQSGFNAYLATIPALVTKEDVIFSDELNHASIIDGLASPVPRSCVMPTLMQMIWIR